MSTTPFDLDKWLAGSDTTAPTQPETQPQTPPAHFDLDQWLAGSDTSSSPSTSAEVQAVAKLYATDFNQQMAGHKDKFNALMKENEGNLSPIEKLYPAAQFEDVLAIPSFNAFNQYQGQLREHLARQGKYSEAEQAQLLEAFERLASPYQQADTWLNSANDALVNTAAGFTQFGERLANNFGARNWASNLLRAGTTKIDQSLSAKGKIEKYDTEQSVAEAERTGGQLAAIEMAAKKAAEYPAYVRDLGLRELPPQLAVAYLTRGKASGVSGAGLEMGALLGEWANQVEQLPQAELEKLEPYQRRIAQGMTPKQARADLANTDFFEDDGLKPYLLAAGVLGSLDRYLSFAKGGNAVVRQTATKTFVKSLLGDMVREAGQETAAQINQNLANNELKPNAAWYEGAMKGTGAAGFYGGALGAMSGTVGGGVAAYQQGQTNKQQQAVDNLVNPEKAPEADTPTVSPYRKSLTEQISLLKNEETRKQFEADFLADEQLNLLDKRRQEQSEYGEFVRNVLAGSASENATEPAPPTQAVETEPSNPNQQAEIERVNAIQQTVSDTRQKAEAAFASGQIDEATFNELNKALDQTEAEINQVNAPPSSVTNPQEQSLISPQMGERYLDYVRQVQQMLNADPAQQAAFKANLDKVYSPQEQALFNQETARLFTQNFPKVVKAMQDGADMGVISQIMTEEGQAKPSETQATATKQGDISEQATQAERFSRSPIKSVEANIKRGSEAMFQSLQQQKDVENAMYRDDIGWIDFIWGTEGKVNPNSEKRKGAKGIAHIIEKRMSVDGLTRDEVVDFLENTVPEIVARGSVANDFAVADKRRIVIAHNGNEVHLVKEGRNNAWLLTGFKQNNQEVNQSRGATTSNLRSTDPIRSRIGEVALGSDNVQQTAPQRNSQTQADQQALSRILGEEIASHIEVVDRNTVKPPKGQTIESLKNVEGWYAPSTQKAYIYSDGITEAFGLTREERLAWVAWHELAHKGLNVKYGNTLKSALQQARKHPVVGVISRRIQQRNPSYSEEVAIEEALVELYSAYQTDNWASLNQRYQTRINPGYALKGKYDMGNVFQRFAAVIKRLIAALSKNKRAEMMSEQALFDLIKGVDESVKELESSKPNSNEDTEEGVLFSVYSDDADKIDRAVTKMGLISRRDSSRVSDSEYVIIFDENNEEAEDFKIRVSNHTLPSGYEQANFEVQAKGAKQSKGVTDGSWADAVAAVAKHFGKEIPANVKRFTTQALAETAQTRREAFVNKVAQERAEKAPRAAHLLESEIQPLSYDILNDVARSFRNYRRKFNEFKKLEKQGGLGYRTTKKGRAYFILPSGREVSVYDYFPRGAAKPTSIEDYKQRMAELLDKAEQLKALEEVEKEKAKQLRALKKAAAEAEDESDVRYSFAGEKAQTANLAQLEKAKADIAKGVNPETVRQQTGWFMGNDGKWRFEIEDNTDDIIASDRAAMYFEDNPDALVYETPLDQVLYNAALFEAYPELADYDVVIKSLGDKESGRVTPGEKQIVLNYNQSAEEMSKALVHEVQHAIQEIEGFARGGNVNPEFTQAVKKAVLNSVGEDLSPIHKLKWHFSNLLRGNRPSKAEEQLAELHRNSTPYDIYHSLSGEVEARNVERRLNMSVKERQAISPESTEDLSRARQINLGWSKQSARLNEDPHSEFAKAVDDFIDGNEVKTSISMGTTPDVLKMIGLPDVEVKIQRKTLGKVMRGKHAIEPDTLKQLPQQLNDPVGVFQSSPRSSNPDGYVVLTELTEFNEENNRDESVIVALHLDQAGEVQLIEVASAYGKNHQGLQNILNKDKVYYWNKTKGSQLANAHWLQLPLKLRSEANLSTNDIKTEADLSQYQSEISSEIGEESEGDIRYSRKPKVDPDYQRDLMVTHNISADGIMHAHKMGGLPFASVAVTKQSNPLTGFGEVTLIGNRDYIDPKGANRAKVFGSDIYSPRYPSVTYDIKSKDTEALFNRFKDTAQLLNDSTFRYKITQDVEREGVFGVLRHATPVKYQFLKEKGIDVTLVYETQKTSYDNYASVKEALKNHKDNLSALRGDTVFAKQFIEEELKRTQRRIAFHKSRKDQANVEIYSDYVKVLENILSDPVRSDVFTLAVEEIIKAQHPSDIIDTYQTKHKIDEALKPFKQEFEDYVKNIADSVEVKEKLDNGETRSGTRKYVPHTLENVVKKLKKALRGGESFHYGLPSIRAKVTPQFKTIADIQGNKHRLVSKDDFQAVREAIEQEKDQLADKLGVNRLEMDDLLWNVVDENVSAAFRYADVEDTATHRQYIADFLGKLQAMPTEYFEGKAKDITQFSDFVGAVVPNNLPKNAYDVLNNAGLSIYEYDPSVENARGKAIEQATNELDEQSDGNILFSRRSKSESLEKLREAEPIRISGKEIEPSTDLREYKRNALNYGKTLRGTYVNKDTGQEISIGRAGIQEILRHDYKDPDHLQSIAAIPQIIENAIYIDTLPNEELDKNPDIQEYEYYLAELNIAGNDYVVRAVVGASRKNGERYYDHKLTPINKNELLSLSYRVSTAGLSENNSLSGIDDKRLLHILQDENATAEDEESIRFSRKQSVEDLIKTGKAKDDSTTLTQEVIDRDVSALKSRFHRGMAKLDEVLADSLRPVSDWIDSLDTLPAHIRARIKGRMYRAKTMRNVVRSELENRHMKQIIRMLSNLAKAHKKDPLTVKRLVGFYASLRYSIIKNEALLEQDRLDMVAAEQALNEAKANGEPIDALSRAYRRAERQYRYRKHDVELPANSTAEFKVGTAGGWSIAEAKQYMAGIEKHLPKKKMEAVLRRLSEMQKSLLELDAKSGRYTPEQIAEYMADEFYVPLTGDPNMEDVDNFIGGTGSRSLNISRDKALKGRKLSEAEDAFDAVWKAVSKTTTFYGWQPFKQDFYDMFHARVETLQAGGLSEKSAKAQAEAELGFSVQKMQGMTRSSDNVLIHKELGQYYEIALPKEMVQILKDDHVERAAAWTKFVSVPTRMMARGVTQLTYDFAPKNMLRDTWDKAEMIRDKAIFDKNGNPLSQEAKNKIGRAVWHNMASKEIWKATNKYARGAALDPHSANHAERVMAEFVKYGGLSSFTQNIAQTESDFIKQVKGASSKAKVMVEHLAGYVEAYNGTFDYVSSLATAKALVDNGVEMEQAASLVLDLANFNKTGAKMRDVKGFFMFLQPKMMGQPHCCGA